MSCAKESFKLTISKTFTLTKSLARTYSIQWNANKSLIIFLLQVMYMGVVLEICEQSIKILDSCIMYVNVVLDGDMDELMQACSMNILPSSSIRQVFVRSKK